MQGRCVCVLPHRVQAGQCFHLFNQHRLSKMDEFQLAEMLRTPLEELVLQIKILKLGMAREFLTKALEPPGDKSVVNAITTLTQLVSIGDLREKLFPLFFQQALTPTEELTPLGYHLANLPVHPRVGKMILFAAMFSCLDPVLTIASTLGFKDPFVIPLVSNSLALTETFSLCNQHKQEEADRVKRNFAAGSQSDHIAFLNAFKVDTEYDCSYADFQFGWLTCCERTLFMHRGGSRVEGKVLIASIAGTILWLTTHLR